MWAEAFCNTPRSKPDMFGSFTRTILHRLISVDDYGNPNDEEAALIIKKFKDLGFA